VAEAEEEGLSSRRPSVPIKNGGGQGKACFYYINKISFTWSAQDKKRRLRGNFWHQICQQGERKGRREKKSLVDSAVNATDTRALLMDLGHFTRAHQSGIGGWAYSSVCPSEQPNLDIGNQVFNQKRSLPLRLIIILLISSPSSLLVRFLLALVRALGERRCKSRSYRGSVPEIFKVESSFPSEIDDSFLSSTLFLLT
jgi:hypothetical protein